MSTCNPCNGGPLGDYSEWPLAKQYALKRYRDPGWYDRVMVNRIRRRADNSISVREVAEHYVNIKKGLS